MNIILTNIIIGKNECNYNAKQFDKVEFWLKIHIRLLC